MAERPTDRIPAQTAKRPSYPVLLRGSSSHGGHEAEATGAVHDDGVDVEGVGDVELGRFVWVDIGIPGGDVRALGEVVRRDPLQLALEIRFKHLFPDARRRLYTALAR